MTLWRIHLNADNDEGKKPSKEDREKLIQYCFNNNIAGLGWPVDGEPKTPDDYVSLLKQEYGSDGKKYSSAIDFAKSINPNDLIWARHPDKVFYLGKITGDWRYVKDNGFGIPNQRACIWRKVDTDQVPKEIPNHFQGGFQTLQRVSTPDEATTSSLELWDKLSS